MNLVSLTARRLALLPPLALVACPGGIHEVGDPSAQDAAPPPPEAGADAGAGTRPDASADVGSLPLVTQSGSVIDFVTREPIAGATVTVTGHAVTTVTTDASGAYAFSVRAGVPYIVSAVASGYVKNVYPERSLSADESDGSMNLVSQVESKAVASLLSGYDASLGVVAVEVIATGGCASVDGATITVSPAGQSQVRYFVNGQPSATQASAVAGAVPSALFYDVQPGVPLRFGVTHPTCTLVPFPTDQNGVHYTGGGIDAVGGGATNYVGLYLQ
jgi:hypothetical protein